MRQTTIRCVKAYTFEIPASQLIDQSGKVICDVPASSIRHEAGEEQSFSKLSDAKRYMTAPNNAGMWELV